MQNKKHIPAIIIFFFTFSAFLNVQADEYLFKFRDNVELSEVLLDEAELQNQDILASALGVYTCDDIEILKYYESLGILEYYERNEEVELFEMPSCKDFSSYFGFGAPCASLADAYGALNVDELWQLGFTGKGVRVAVIDSGISPHVAVKNNLIGGHYYVSDELEQSNPDIVKDYYDGYGHGTMVAGFIGANSDDYKGIAYECDLISLRIFNEKGSGGDLEKMSKAILEAVDVYDCDVINISAGINETNITDIENNAGFKTLKNAVDYATKAGAVIVSAAGNSGNSSLKTDSYVYPASFENVVSVGNIELGGSLASSSQKNDKIDVTAVGTFLVGLKNAESGYVKKSGTSFSCPQVSAIAALILSADKNITPKQTLNILRKTAADLGDAGYDVKYGYGHADCVKIVPEILDGKIYRSDVVKYNGTYNIAVRNGISEKYESVYVAADYVNKKMTGISLQKILLEYGENDVFCFTASPQAKIFEFDAKTLVPKSESLIVG